MGLFYCMKPSYTYKKSERTKSRKQVEKLFRQGQTFTLFPLKLYYLQEQTKTVGVKAGFAVSTRNFKNASDRNRIKRLMREAYRTSNAALKEYSSQHQKEIVLFIIYLDKNLPEYSIVQTKMQQALKKLVKELHETVTENT